MKLVDRELGGLLVKGRQISAVIIGSKVQVTVRPIADIQESAFVI